MTTTCDVVASLKAQLEAWESGDDGPVMESAYETAAMLKATLELVRDGKATSVAVDDALAKVMNR